VAASQKEIAQVTPKSKDLDIDPITDDAGSCGNCGRLTDFCRLLRCKGAQIAPTTDKAKSKKRAGDKDAKNAPHAEASDTGTTGEATSATPTPGVDASAPTLIEELRSAVQSGHIGLLKLVLEQIETNESRHTRYYIGNTAIFEGEVITQLAAKTGNDAVFHWLVCNKYGSSNVKIMAQAAELLAHQVPVHIEPTYYETLAIIHKIKDKHALTEKYFRVLDWYLLVVPGAAVSGTSAILAFIASSATIGAELASLLLIAVGVLAIMSGFFKSASDYLQYKEQERQHKAVATELGVILEGLEVQPVSGDKLRLVQEQV
jgi:hypothetical protein